MVEPTDINALTSTVAELERFLNTSISAGYELVSKMEFPIPASSANINAEVYVGAKGIATRKTTYRKQAVIRIVRRHNLYTNLTEIIMAITIDRAKSTDNSKPTTYAN